MVVGAPRRVFRPAAGHPTPGSRTGCTPAEELET